MGKEDETESEEDSSEDKSKSNEDTVDNSSNSEEENKEKIPPEETEKVEETKKDPEELRKVIKLDSKEEKDGEKKDDKIKEDVSEDDSKDRKSLEQKRAILQNIKDFDFQIKKNQQEITNLNKKIGSVTKDLDDLVSLYEIVSEQMNPFVGLSKVTKKRIDALENFMSDIDNLKNRVGDLESFAERTTGNFDELKNLKDSQKEFLQKAKKMGPDKFAQGNKQSGGLSDEDIDMIIEKSFKELNLDKKIDEIIDEFVDNIENENKI